MARRVGLWLLWLGFIGYILWFSPPLQPDTLQPLQTLLSGHMPYINPIIVSLFSMIGIWLLIYSCLIFADGRMQRLPAWVFVLAGVGTGVLGLIPYLALRQPNQSFVGHKDAWLKLMDARSTGIILTLSTVILFAYALIAGDWTGYLQDLQSDRFIHAMSLAFCLFCLLFPTLLGDDMARRKLDDPRIFWAVALVPLLGPLLYLCLRPPLAESA
jgi:hypothetical protein